MRYLLFDTIDTDNIKKNESTYSLYFNQQIECSAIVITNVIIPNTVYNVNQNNNLIMIEGNPYYLKLGYYDNITKLLTELMNVLNKYTYTKLNMTFSATNYLFTVDNITNKVSLMTTGIGYDITVDFRNCGKLFGFPNNSIEVINGNALIAPNVYNLNSVPSIYLRCNNIHSGYIFNNNITTILFRLPINVPFGKNIIYSNTSTDIRLDVNHLNALDIRLTDELNRNIDLNGADWKIEFLIE